MEDLRVRSRCLLGCAALLAATTLSGASKADTPDLAGIWWATEYHPKIAVLGGGELPLTAAGKAAYEKNIAGLKDGAVTDAARKFCVPDGVPRVLANPYPFEIVNGPPGQVTILYELNHQVRPIGLDRSLPEEDMIAFPAFNGHSVGRFEGDALVVESGGFNERTFLDATGTPHTDELHTVERIRRIGPDELEDVITIHDPDYYAKDWQARFVYKLRNDVKIEDYVCGEPHRDISSVSGVRRP